MPTTTIPEVQFRTFGGVRLRYADTGGSTEPTILLTSPWPESIYAFAPIWSTLAEHARLFAIDLPGFGASDRDDDVLSPRTMGRFLSELIVEAELARPTSSRRTSGPRPLCSPPQNIPSGSRA